MNNEKLFKKHTIDGGFLQSKHWRKFQEKLGRQAFSVENDGFLLNAYKHQLPLVGGYFFVPRGPVFSSNSDSESFCKNFGEVLDKAKKAGAGWLRIEPQQEDDLLKIKKSLERKWAIKKSKKDHEPAETLMIDLRGKNEDEILGEMKQKTRYNIRLSEKKGVEVEIREPSSSTIEAFYDLAQETAKRDGISIHSKDYYRKMFDAIPRESLKLFLAKYQGERLGANIVSFYGGVATYLHGASSSKHRSVMAPYALQWAAIREAKNAGCEFYDLGGISTEGDKQSSWKGITRFKQGFAPNGRTVKFPGCWDIVIDKKKYWLYRFLQGAKDLRLSRKFYVE